MAERPARFGADVTALGALAVAVRLPALLATRHHEFDDGVYGASAAAMRDGGVPFRDVFSSQGPLHLPLVFAGDLVAGRPHWGPRVASVAAGVVVTVAVYALARRFTTRTGAVAGGLLAATSGALLWTTAPITSDGPLVAAVAVALWQAVRYVDAPGWARAVGVGIPIGVAGALKPALGAVGVVVAVVVLVRPRRPGHVAAAAGVAALVGLVPTLAFGPAEVWDQAVRYQLDSVREQSVVANVAKVGGTLLERDAVLVGFAALAVVSAPGALAAARRRVRDPVRDRLELPVPALLALWGGLVALFLVAQPALWRNHLASLVVPIALLVAWWLGSHPPSLRAVAVVLAVAVPVQAVLLADLLAPAPYGGPEAAAHDALVALPAGAWAISDEPGLVWRAGRRTPDDLVDASIKQQQQDRITTARLVEVAVRPEVGAVLVWSARRWGALDDLPDALETVGYEVAERFDGQDGARVLYRRAADPGPEALTTTAGRAGPASAAAAPAR